jgi:tRNA 2-thiouridine synthesizing protein D
MTTRFSLLLQQSPFAGQSFASALQFARAALANGYLLEQIFLYEDAVLAVQPGIDLPVDEPNLAAQLASFCQQQQIPLLYCVTAAEKRGVFANTHTDENADANNPFIAAGLAEFAMRLTGTKVVQF